MRLILLGPPGAGKGTQAKSMAASLGVPHVSTGDMLRAAVSSGSEVGRRAKKYMDAGELVPDAVVVAIVAERLREPDAAGGWLLDGFPRTEAQAAALDEALAGLGQHLDRVLYLAVPDEVVVRRLSGRRTCRGCGANFHEEFMPPRKEGVCDACGGELYQREDDEARSIRERLAVYAAETEPLVARYRASDLLTEVSAGGTPGEVRAAIHAALPGKTAAGGGA